MCKISVVVPVYNSEATVKKCIDSILAQTFTDFELIIINDGSTDNSAVICDSLAKSDSRIKYISQENRGLAGVRNRGMETAAGKYIYFVDSDDYIDPECLDFMHSKAEETNADIVLCGYIMENGKSVLKLSAKPGLVNHENINDRIVELKSKNLIDPAWNKLYKLTFIISSGVKMPVGEYYEDTSFNLDLLTHKPIISVYSECFYHYVLHMGSITRRYNPEKIETIKQRARQLKRCTSGVDDYCDFYFIKSVFSSIIDMFLSCSRDVILKKISEEISTEEFKSAAANAFLPGRSNAVIIKTARSGNAKTVYLFCLGSYFLKFKMQRLFMKVRGK